jgi:hypothetical protein
VVAVGYSMGRTRFVDIVLDGVVLNNGVVLNY